jgi:peptide subunit release factor 1 (eRF1)
MGTFRSLRRNLNAEKIWIAQQVAEERNEIVKAFVEERVKKDAEFAQDVLNAVGENLPEHIRKAAEETIKNGPQVEKQGIVDSVVESISTLKGKL